MTHEQFKEQIYKPYNDAWKVIKILQEAYQKPELFMEYQEAVQRFADDYVGNDFAQLLKDRLLLRADDVVAKMDKAEAKG